MIAEFDPAKVLMHGIRRMRSMEFEARNSMLLQESAQVAINVCSRIDLIKFGRRSVEDSFCFISEKKWRASQDFSAA